MALDLLRIQALCFDVDGTIADIRISYPCDLTTQMLEYSEATSGWHHNT